MFYRAEYKLVAKERLQGSWKYMAGIYGIIFGLILFYGLFSHVPILGISLSVVCGSCLLFSSIRMNRKLHHDEKVQLADLLSGFSHCFKLCRVVFMDWNLGHFMVLLIGYSWDR